MSYSLTVAIVILWLGICGFHWWDPLAKLIGLGNESFAEGEYDEAMAAYVEAGKLEPGSMEVDHNLGAALFKSEQYEAAMEKFSTAAESDDLKVRSQALYNKGCTQIVAGDHAGAAESFIETLRIDPENMDAKVNLELANLMLQQMPSPTPQQQQSDQENQENQENQTPQPDSTPPAPSPSPGKDQQDQQDDSQATVTPTPGSQGQPPEESQGTPTPQQSEPVEAGSMSPEEAERLLDALEEEELEVLKRFHQLPKVDERDVEKDW